MKLALLSILVLLLGIFWFMGQSDWHLHRNKHNIEPQGGLKQLSEKVFTDDIGRMWERQPAIKNKFHQPAAGEEMGVLDHPYPNVEGEIEFDSANPNVKFLSLSGDGGSYEAILQPNGAYLLEGGKKGTYNYGHPEGLRGTLKHVVWDVIPHFINADYKN